MVRNLGFCGVLLAVLLAWPAQARAAPCDAAERQMAYGAAAMEEAKTAKDKAAYLRAARQFEGASRTAPNCAAARFNMGFAYEHAGELQAAKDAYGAYLRLAPNASDARAVRQRMYKLEYRIGRAEDSSNLAGNWCYKRLDGVLDCAYRISASGSTFEMLWKGTLAARGSVRNRAINGTYYVEFYPQKCPTWPRPMSGNVSDDWKRMELTVSVPDGATWIKATNRCVIRKTKTEIWRYNRR